MWEFMKWYLQKFGSRDFMGIWLAWMGMVTLCVVELYRAFKGGGQEFSTVFTTVLGGVIGYVVGTRAVGDRKKK